MLVWFRKGFYKSEVNVYLQMHMRKNFLVSQIHSEKVSHSLIIYSDT